MPTVVVDSSVLISLAAGEQFHLLRELYSAILLPPEVWNEVCSCPKPFGGKEAKKAREDGWLTVQRPRQLNRARGLDFNLDPGETEALALALEFPEVLLLIDDAQGRRAAQALGISFTGTLGVLLRGKVEGKLAALRPVLELMKRRTTFWLGTSIHEAALRKAGESAD